MSFFIGQKEFIEMSGRTKSAVIKARASGKLPDTRLKDGRPIFDIDNEFCKVYLSKIPNHHGASKKTSIRKLQEACYQQRAAGTLVCLKTGLPDQAGATDPTGDTEFLNDELLDRQKKQKEIEHKTKQIEKMDLSILAMKGGLIEREYVHTWIQRYLGVLHTRFLEIASSGICEDMYNIAHRNKDSQVAIKEMEKIMAKLGSDTLKGAARAIESNPV